MSCPACVRTLAAAAFTLALGAVPASADLLVYDFSVAPTTGPLANQTLHGRFTYDSSIVPVGGRGIVTTGPGGSALRSFGLDLGDTRFTAGNVSATLIFDNGALSRFRIGETGPQSLLDGSDYFFMDSLFGWGEFKLAGDNTLYGGALNAQRVNPQIDTYIFAMAPLDGPLLDQTLNGSFALDHAIAKPNT